MIKRPFLITLTGIFFLSTFTALAQRRGPSTAQERERAVEMVTFLEKSPLAKEAKGIRSALLVFLADVPDISVKLCGDVLGDLKRQKGDYHGELLGQLIYSQAKFMIENPDKSKDDLAVYVAGVEGVLRTWQAIKAEKPKAKYPLMDELLEKQQAGELAAQVKINMGECK
jgi:hypothetical protein